MRLGHQGFGLGARQLGERDLDGDIEAEAAGRARPDARSP